MIKKREHVFIFLFLFFIMLFNFSKVDALGVFPSKIDLYFEPGLTKTFTFTIIDINPKTNVKLYVKYEGEIKDVISLSDLSYAGDGRKKFTATLSLPSEGNFKPGVHRILIGVKEVPKEPKGVMGLVSIQVPIDIFVLYPGPYIEASLSAKDIEINGTEEFRLKVKNLGEKATTIEPRIDILNNNRTIISLPFNLSYEDALIKPKESKEFIKIWDSSGNPAGSYKAIARVKYNGNESKAESRFMIGELAIEIINYTKNVIAGKINKFDLVVASKWNNEIKGIYGDIYIMKNNQTYGQFKTITFDLAPWEEKVVSSYWDNKLWAGEYDIKIKLNYNGRSIEKYGKIYVKKQRPKGFIIGISIIIALIITFISYILLKKRRKKGKNNVAQKKDTKKKRKK